jgi:ATP-dependent RNA helicase DeaD
MRAALERGSRIVVVAPPAPEQLAIWDLMGPGTVIVCADQTAATDWVAAAPPGRSVHALTALPRAARLLKAGTIDILAGSVPDLAALVAATHLKLHAVPTLVLAWPEGLVTGEHGDALDELLGEAGDARRIILTWDPAALEPFLERQAHRAPVFGTAPIDDQGRRAAPLGPARYAVATPERRLTVLRQVIDALDPPTVLVWTSDERHAARLRDILALPADAVVTGMPDRPARLVVCARPPSREQFATLAQLGPVVLLGAPYQLAYLRSIAAPLDAVPLAPAAQAARDRSAQLRERLAARLERGDVDAELEQLAPLFERFDPAEVAAALLALGRQEAASIPAAAPAVAAGRAAGAAPAWVKVFVNVGKRDRAAAKDLVGALTREVGVAKEDIGKVEVRDAFCLVEIASHASEAVLKGLSRVTIRGRRVTARPDRPR